MSVSKLTGRGDDAFARAPDARYLSARSSIQDEERDLGVVRAGFFGAVVVVPCLVNDRRCHLEKTLVVLQDEAACASEGRTLAIDTDLICLPVRPANDPCLDSVGRAVRRCRGEHDRQTSNIWSGKHDRPFERALRNQTPASGGLTVRDVCSYALTRPPQIRTTNITPCHPAFRPVLTAASPPRAGGGKAVET